MNNRTIIRLLYIPIVAMIFASVYYGYSDAMKMRKMHEAPPKIVYVEVKESEEESTEPETECESTVVETVPVVVETVPVVIETETEVESEPETETEPVPEPTTEAVTEETEEPYPLYTVDGDFLDEDLQRFIYEELKIEGIEWWMPYAVLTAYQESGFKIYDVTNGLDCGLLQYRKTFWADTCAKFGYPGADIFNPYVQIVCYVKQTANRLKNLGCDVATTISRHKQSDWGPYDQEYVNQVMGHDIVRIR